MFRRKQAIGKWYILPPHLISVSVLPCKTENTEIMSFRLNVVHCFGSRHTKHIKIITWSQIDCLSFVKLSTVYIKQHQDYRAQSIQPSVMYTVSIHHICSAMCRGPVGETKGAMSRSCIRRTWKVNGRYQCAILPQYLNKIMLTAIKHVANNSFFFFQQYRALAHHARNIVQMLERETLNFTSFLHIPPTAER